MRATPLAVPKSVALARRGGKSGFHIAE